MYAVYCYGPGSTQANVLADVVKLLTGTTDKSTLSASCVQANTNIISTVAAGWTVHDAAAGSNIQCLKAFNQDAATYKYYLLQLGSTTAISGCAPEGWNATTHAATNATSYAASVWNASSGGYMYIHATTKNIVIQNWTPSGLYATLNGMALFELSRDTIPVTYPCGVLLNADTNFGRAGFGSTLISRAKKNSTTGDLLNGVIYASALIGGAASSYTISGDHTFRDASDAYGLAVYRFGCAGDAGGVLNGCQLGVVYDLFVCGSSAVNPLDEITYSGVTYAVFKGTIPYGALLIPKA